MLTYKVIKTLFKSRVSLFITSAVLTVISWFFLPYAISIYTNLNSLTNLFLGWIVVIIAFIFFGYAILNAVWLTIKSIIQLKWLWVLAGLLVVGCDVAIIVLKLL